MKVGKGILVTYNEQIEEFYDKNGNEDITKRVIKPLNEDEYNKLETVV